MGGERGWLIKKDFFFNLNCCLRVLVVVMLFLPLSALGQLWFPQQQALAADGILDCPECHGLEPPPKEYGTWVIGDHGGHYMRNPDGCMPRSDGMPGHCAQKSLSLLPLLFSFFHISCPYVHMWDCLICYGCGTHCLSHPSFSLAGGSGPICHDGANRVVGSLTLSHSSSRLYRLRAFA